MRIASESQDKFGWYSGRLKQDGYNDEYVLAEGDDTASINGSDFLDGVWSDFAGLENDILLYGCLDAEEKITGNMDFSLKGVEAAAYVLKDDYDGWKVAASGNDLVFTNGWTDRVYSGDSLDELEENMQGWFGEEEIDEMVEEVEELGFVTDHWPWKDE